MNSAIRFSDEKQLGAAHHWIRGDIAQTRYSVSDDGEILTHYLQPQDKYTKYTCAVCGVLFVHRYGMVPMIEEAIAQAAIPKDCVKTNKSAAAASATAGAAASVAATKQA